MKFAHISHEERIRGRKTFRLSLVMGVLGGGAFGAGLELGISYFFEKVSFLEPQMWVVYLLFISSVLLMYIAFRYSENIESWVIYCEIRHSTSKLMTLLDGALDFSKEFPQMEHFLLKYKGVISDKESYLHQKMKLLRDFTEEVLRICGEISDSEDRNIVSFRAQLLPHISEIIAFPDNLQKLHATLKDKMGLSSIFGESGWNTHWDKDTLHVTKKEKVILSKTIMRIALLNNLKNSISTPYVCYISINSSISSEECDAALKAFNDLLVEALGIKEALEYNLRKFIPQEEQLLTDMKENIRAPILKDIDARFGRIFHGLDNVLVVDVSEFSNEGSEV